MVTVIIRTIILYLIIIMSMRIMGKRQLGELQPVELAVTLMIADMGTVPMQNADLPLLNGIVPVLILVSLEVLFSALMLKCHWFSNLISGNPVVIIKDGKVIQKALKKMRMTVDDLCEALRGQDVFDLKDVGSAIVETNGKISVYLRPEARPATSKEAGIPLPDDGIPILIVQDGQPCDWALDLCGLDIGWVNKKLRKENIPLKEVLIMTSNRKGTYQIVKKEKS